MDFRKTFDLIPERFDQYRPRYCPELFQELTSACRLAPDKRVLEIGPGTGQATEPVLQTGCEYTALKITYLSGNRIIGRILKPCVEISRIFKVKQPAHLVTCVILKCCALINR